MHETPSLRGPQFGGGVTRSDAVLSGPYRVTLPLCYLLAWRGW